MISGEDPSNHLQMITWNQRLPQSIHNMYLKHFLLLAQIVKQFHIDTTSFLIFLQNCNVERLTISGGALETLENI